MSGQEVERRKSLQRAAARVRRLAAAVDTRVDRVRWGVKRRFGWIEPLEILGFRGYGTDARATLLGRVVEAKGHEPPSPQHDRWDNFVRMVRRLDSDEVPNVRVAIEFGGVAAVTTTDSEGYFSFDLRPAALPAVGGGWHEAVLELRDSLAPGQGAVRARAEILVPDPAAELAIISDIDDTVLQTHVTNLVKMMRVTMLGNALTRLPFEGTTELYRALVAGRSGRGKNPVFYVSKSPWNLYDLLTDFMDRHGLPRGPLLLRDLGLHTEGSLDFKQRRIAELLELYPSLRFVLVGDSGERDPEIYLEVMERHPGRVVAVYIREVEGRPGRRAELERHVERARALGGQMLLLAHARDALAHARAHGLAAA